MPIMCALTFSPGGPGSPITPLWPPSPWNTNTKSYNHNIYIKNLLTVNKRFGTNSQLPLQHPEDPDLHQDLWDPAGEQD